MTARPLVLYIGGLDRSGSTLLAGMFDQFDDALSVGELPMIWRHGWGDNWRSSDGYHFNASPFWTAVLDRVRVALPGFDPQEALDLAERVYRQRQSIPLRLGLARRPPTADQARYVALFEALYLAIAAESNTKLIVDSGKLPFHAALMMHSPATDLRLTHIVRDPRGVAQSRQRFKMNENPGKGAETPMMQQAPARVAARWILCNLLIDAIKGKGSPFARISYTQLAENPGPTLAKLITDLSLPLEPAEAVSAFQDGSYDIKPGVAFAGNSHRFTLGPTPIQPDNAWQTSLPASSQVLIAALTAPWRRLY